ncbi:hypothetical protein CHARACLAT_010986 [Characodon lateralis]|uniref:Uncharacterized protein n=1 Tax=Characodon lateralis TaxID=208331 RepID=A0ABU7DFK1_9TELE|nr:hypothetical protein [Characodon lateralis]
MVLLTAPVNSAGPANSNCPLSAFFSPLGLQSLTGGNPDPPAAPGALAASCLSSDPHTSTFPDGRHVRDGTVDPLDGVESGGEVTGVRYSPDYSAEDYLRRRLPATHCQSVALSGFLNLILPCIESCLDKPSSGKKQSSSMNKDSSLSLTGKQPLGFSTPLLADPSTILFCILVPVPCIIHPVVNKHFTEQYHLLNCFLHNFQVERRIQDRRSSRQDYRRYVLEKWSVTWEPAIPDFEISQQGLVQDNSIFPSNLTRICTAQCCYHPGLRIPHLSCGAPPVLQWDLLASLINALLAWHFCLDHRAIPMENLQLS